jgi:hypothetical protein
MKSDNKDVTHLTSSAVVQIGRLSYSQVRNLAETIGAAFLDQQEYANGNFTLGNDWRNQFREFLNTGTIHENIAQTAGLLTSPHPVINRFGDSITGLDEPLTRGDVRQAYQYMLEVDNGVGEADMRLLGQWINGRTDNTTLIAPDNQFNLQTFFAAASGNDNAYITGLVNNIDPDTMLDHLSLVDAAGNTALHLAALNGHFDAVETLANAGANTEYRNNAGENAIHAAVRGASTDVLAIILRDGDRFVNQANHEGQAPIMLTDNQEIRNILLEIGAEEERRQPITPPASIKRSRRNDYNGDKDNSGSGFAR